MTTKKEVLNFISLIRESHPNMVDIYTKGSCLNFFLILKSHLKGKCIVEPYYNVDHIISKITPPNEKPFYADITGEIFDLSHYLPFKDYYPKKGFIRAFRLMYRAYWSIK